ncbi:unnamed protein product (macronuclear) [Paramecium tetraurelia]|uniref:Signal sequence receptor subunit gamma n=1 Tax=Paramecium tetraurelia TaxID=5888 RepID=A0CIG9_PARTE|nr:uncharacterized protein GSPATT00007721001 [Paramecium tetraurelia]CAK70586.1 unnamed protein product [Paramecium tetraurelia]|eukprot:XP_001437983.1 hypothetical protein (macronuclear) [Paramecium tetraurelia strain d4-2]
MSEEQAVDFTFSSLLPTAEKLMTWLTYSTVIGLISFPLIALTIDQQFAIHFWILTLLNAGLLFTLLYLKGQLSQIEREKKEFTQDESKKPQKKKKSLENEKDKVAQKAKKESQKNNTKNFNKSLGKQKSFQQRK